MTPDRYSKKMFPPSKGELLKSYHWGQILEHETRISILMYLRMNGRLSFSQIVDLVNKSRSTVHHHLQIMIKGGIIHEVLDSESDKDDESKPEPKFDD